MSNQDWKDKFNTQLSPREEDKFQEWLASRSKTLGRDLSGDLNDYDLRGFWIAGGEATSGHGTDKYKKPNHPTFSDESIYSGVPDNNGGRYVGGSWIGDDKKGWSFVPSQEMLSKTHSAGDMMDYFSKYEKDVKLVLPTPYAPISDYMDLDTGEPQ